ncbi:MAG: site-2 protease family protein [Promethearchaeota archaeon]
MNKNRDGLTVSEKIRRIVAKYYNIIVFDDNQYSFEPICIIELNDIIPHNSVNEINYEFREIGYQVKFHKLSKYEIEEYKLRVEPPVSFYKLTFEAKVFSEKQKEKRTISRNQIIQLSLLILTTGMVIFSAYFYVFQINPYYSGYGKSLGITTFSIISFCLGIFLIIVIHEFGHILFSRKHKIDSSLPYLIPGPPPLGILGAFVSIKDEPQTRNQKFDVATGGIVCGIIISLILVIIGLLFSEQVDTNVYLQARADYFGNNLTDEAEFVKHHLNFYNITFLGLRFLIFGIPSYGDFYGVSLPESILVLHPLAFTGWIGLCLSALNLIPIPFLDGGHILRTISSNLVVRSLGLIIGVTFLLFLHPTLISFSSLITILACCSTSISLQVVKGKNADEVPFAMIPLTRNRKILAVGLILIFIILFPLSYNNILYGFGI